MRKFTLLFTVFIVAATTVFSQNKENVIVSNLAELREQTADGTTIYEVSGEVILTHQHGQRNQKYFQDATAAILVDDDDAIITTVYNLYDGVTGLTGTLTTYRELLQFVPTADPGAATSNDNEFVPQLVTLADIAPVHQGMLVRINSVEFTGTETTFSSSTNYAINDGTSDAVIFRTPSSSAALDYFGTPVPATTDMFALVGQFDNDMQIFARSLADFYPDGLPSYTVTFNVIDENDAPVTDAVLTFDGITLAAGTYVVEDVNAGNYDYSIEKAGYYTRSGQVAVTDEVAVNIVLVPEDANAVSSFPWTEGFEGETFPPADWSHYALGEGTWAITATANSGTKAAWHNFTTGEADSWLITPQIQIGEEDNLLMKFFQRNGFMDDYGFSAVLISEGSGNPIHEEFEVVYEASSPISSYSERIVNLGDYAGKTIYIAFQYKGTAAHQWFIDDVVVEAAPEAIIVDNISALYDVEAGGDLIYQVSNEVIITHQQLAYRGQIYIQDDSGAIMVDDAAGIITTAYNNYDGITNIKGKLSVFQEMLQFVPTEDFGTPTSTGNTVEPMEVTLADLNVDLQAMLVVVRNVSFDFDNENFPADHTFAQNQSYYIVDASGTGEIRTPNATDLLDYYGTAIPTTPKDIVGVLHQRYEVTRLQPRSVTDFLEPTSIQEIEAAGFSMFPSPATTNFNIHGEQTIDHVRVYNMSGQLVMQEEVNSRSAVIDVSVLKTGVYIVQVIYGNKQLNYKLQVQK
jgi:hypothetical protein